MNLKPCPCGETPESLHIDQLGTKWAYASGNCCNEWNIEFRLQYETDAEEAQKIAADYWNQTVRAPIPS
jgi:hypothetical protein